MPDVSNIESDAWRRNCVIRIRKKKKKRNLSNVRITVYVSREKLMKKNIDEKWLQNHGRKDKRRYNEKRISF